MVEELVPGLKKCALWMCYVIWISHIVSTGICVVYLLYALMYVPIWVKHDTVWH